RLPLQSAFPSSSLQPPSDDERRDRQGDAERDQPEPARTVEILTLVRRILEQRDPPLELRRNAVIGHVIFPPWWIGAFRALLGLTLEHLVLLIREPPEVLVGCLGIDHHELGVLELVEAFRPELPSG